MKVLRNEQEAEMATLAGKLQEGEEKRTKQLTIKLSEKDADCAKHKSIIDNLKLGTIVFCRFILNFCVVKFSHDESYTQITSEYKFHASLRIENRR